jgi:hypothetical protein
MIPLRSIPTLAISFAALLFVAWMTSGMLRSGSLYAERAPTQGAALIDPGPQSAR